MEKKVLIAIIGGGAAGLAAAAAAVFRFGDGCALILEKQEKIGRKLLATGNGRCNISNRSISYRNYSGDPSIIRSVLSDYKDKHCESFLSKLGLLLRSDHQGRMYPYSNKAATVLQCFQMFLKQHNIQELCQFQIRTIQQIDDKWLITSNQDTVIADYIIFATGSKASPNLGSDDSGLQLLEDLGIFHNPLYPSLCPINTKEKYSLLKGIRAQGIVSLLGDGKKIDHAEGEIQFTDKGLSGICIFDLSEKINRFFQSGSIDDNYYKQLRISLDLVKDFDSQYLFKYIKSIRELWAEMPAEQLFCGILDNKLSAVLIQKAGLQGLLCKEVSDKAVRQITYSCKNFSFTPINSDNFSASQVCGGGISSQEIDPDTLMSRKLKNLYICGELLDVVGMCGGYNLHFAIGSAIKAVSSIQK